MRNEKGRSLVEITAILALMGILTVSSIRGFHNLINKHKANLIVHDAELAYIDEDSSQNPHTDWAAVSFTPDSQKEIFSMHDKIGQVFVKVNDIEEEICRLLLEMRTEKKINFYSEEGEEFLECAFTNNILFAFEDVGKPAQCAHNIDCGEEFLGYCDAQGQCIQCDDKSQTLNEDRNGCICDAEFALSCNDGETSWCCGYDEEYHPLICGRHNGECINPDDMCWMNIQKRGPSQKDCVYDIGTLVENCANEVVQENGLTVLKELEGLTCSKSDSYCLLGYTDSDHTSGIDTTFTTGTLYGTCLNVEDLDEISISTMSAIGADCVSGEYCFLNYTNESRTQTVTSTFLKGTLYGTCISVEDFDEINPTSFNIGNLDEEQGCPMGYYCNVQWTDNSCGGTVDENFSTGTLYGVCLKLNDFTPTCPY